MSVNGQVKRRTGNDEPFQSLAPSVVAQSAKQIVGADKKSLLSENWLPERKDYFVKLPHAHTLPTF